jgi:phage terminase large subunit GpA-like protein
VNPEYVISLIWELWQEGTRQEFMIPCPHCQTYFAPKSTLLKIPPTTLLSKIERETCLICPHCEQLIPQKYQHELLLQGKMIGPGQWVDGGNLQGELIDTRIASFHVNGLLSPWRTWGQRAIEYFRAMESKNTSRIQVVINTSFGECFDVEAVNSVSWEVVANKRQQGWLMGTLPSEAILSALTGFADVQGDRLVYTICGWHLNAGKLEMYLLVANELYGNTFEQEVWEEFAKLLEIKIDGMPIKQWGIDSGFNPSRSKRGKKMAAAEGESTPRNIIYEFVREHKQVLMTKGSPRRLNRPWSRSLIDVSVRGKTVKSGLDLWTLDTDYFKSDIMAHLMWDDEKTGRWHYPEDTPDEFFRQVCSEYKNMNGSWDVKDREENHFLDCIVGNLFLATRDKSINSKRPLRRPAKKRNSRYHETGYD